MKIKLSLLFSICCLISFSQNFDKKVNDLILNYENDSIIDSVRQKVNNLMSGRPLFDEN